MKTLFIGGSLDGKVIDVPEEWNTYEYILTPCLSSSLMDKDDQIRARSVPSAIYKREFFTGIRQYSAMVIQGEPGLCPMRKLLEGYRTP